jgi:hypothetical protein
MARDGMGRHLPRILARCHQCGQITKGYRLASGSIRLDDHRAADNHGLFCRGADTLYGHTEV